MTWVLLLIACAVEPDCMEIEASVADSEAGHCDPCLDEELSLDACGVNTCGRPMRARAGADGCFAQYTVRDAAGEVIATPSCAHAWGEPLFDGNTCERVPWTPPGPGSYELEVAYELEGEIHASATHAFEVAP